MKIEKLSDNQIRCTLNKHDLIDRELKISELAYGSEKAKGLFRDMMNQAFDEFGFEADDIPLVIEAIPVSGDCIILIVTKVEDPEELDTRFAKFSPSIQDTDEDEYEDEDPEQTFANLMDDNKLETPGDVLDFIKKVSEAIIKKKQNMEGQNASAAADPQGQSGEPNEDLKTTAVYSFNSLDDVSLLAQAISNSFVGKSTLYKDAASHKYYLVLVSWTEEFPNMLYMISEYGNKAKGTPAAIAHFKEHYETLIRENAIEILAKL